MGTQARTRLSASNIFGRSPVRSRTSGNFFIGCRVMGRVSLSINAEQACRTLPLMTIVQDPHTSSRQAASQDGGLVFLPSAVTGLRWICISTEMTLALGRRSTWNSSHRCGWLRSTRTTSFPSVIVPRLRREDGVLQALQLGEFHLGAVGRPAAHAVLQPLLVARLPGGHELGVVLRLCGLGLGKDEFGLVVAAAALVAHAAVAEDQARDLVDVPELGHVGG